MIYCHRDRCHDASSAHTLKLPNGLVRGRDGLIYVPSTLDGSIGVFALAAGHLREKVDTIETGLPLDNLSVDGNGDLFAAAIPQIHTWAKSALAPFDVRVPSTVLRIRRAAEGAGGEARRGREGGYVVEKVVEDDGAVLPGSTVAVHDVVTGRLFMGGAMSPFITICEPSRK